ncbi:MAG: hypothetical protein K2M02_09035 [Duncaniella sp.]|nr:hypothetical protein [Duncaniella sp.]
MDTQNTNKNTQRVATKSTKDNEAAKRAAMMGGAAILGGGAVAAANEIFDEPDSNDGNLTPEDIASQVAGGGVAASNTQGNSGHTGNSNNGNNGTQHTEHHEDEGSTGGGHGSSTGGDGGNTGGSTGGDGGNTGGDGGNTGGDGGNTGGSTGGDGGDTGGDGGDTPEKPEEPIDIDQIIVDGQILPPEDPDLVAMEILDVEQVDDYDIDPNAVLSFDEIGTVYMVDGSEATQASFHLEDGTEGFLVDTTGDGTFDTLTDGGEFAASTEGTAFEMTVDDALLDMSPSPDYMAYDADNDHTDSLGESYANDIIS